MAQAAAGNGLKNRGKRSTIFCILFIRVNLRSLLFLLLGLVGTQACSQQEKSTDQNKTSIGQSNHTNDRNKRSTEPDTASLFPTEQGNFENYAFVLDGKVIEHQALVDYPGSTLNKIFPYTITLDGQEYRGAVYFHTPEHPVTSDAYADDPAWFINGKQVSPFDIPTLVPELYTKIEKSTRDTIIDGIQYKSAIYVDTEEDFFAGRIALPELFDRYIDLSVEDIIVHWRSYSYRDKSDIGMIVYDHFPIYYMDLRGSQSIEIDRIQFAEGERYVVHLVDNRYNKQESIRKKGMWVSQVKARTIFEDPLAIDPTCPCYVADFVDTTGSTIFHLTELKPEPYGGIEFYLKNLTKHMGLPTSKTAGSTTPDSIAVQFVVTRSGMLTRLESIGPDKTGHKNILRAIKQYSCPWSTGAFSGRPVMTRRKMTIFYSRDQQGNIQSLDTLTYQYDK